MITRGILTPDNPLWPRQLQDMEKPPKLLYYWGDLDILLLERAAVIGTRHPSEQARKLTREVAQSYSEYNQAVVSGFAYGVDIEAHLAASKTIAVLSTRLEPSEIYPPEHRVYIDTILNKGGLFLSQYNDSLIGRQYLQIQQMRLMERDCIVANIVDVIVPIQFGKTSGTMHTVTSGMASGRTFYIPLLSKNDKESEGNIKIIRELNLTPLKCVKDLHAKAEM